MRKCLAITLCLVFVALSNSAVTAQSKHRVRFGGYGGPELGITAVNGEFGVLMGGRGGLIINNRWVIGGAGWRIVNNLKTDKMSPNPLSLDMKYGGLLLEYLFPSRDVFLFSVNAVIGGGQVSLDENESNREIGLDRFFIFEPGANLVADISRHFRISLGVGYRFIANARLGEIENSDLAGPTAKATLEFGLF